MRYKPDDVLLWESRDGILKSGQEYLVWETREGWRGQEFTLKHTDHQKVEPIIWWETGQPFVKRQKEVYK